MTTLQYNEIRERVYIVLDGDPYEVLDCHIFRKQQRKPVNQTKLKHMITGKVTERSFGAAETVEEADITKRKIKFLFSKDNRQTGELEYWFVDPENPKDRFNLPLSLFGPEVKFLKENLIIDAMVFNEQIIGARLPIKLEMKVTEAVPAVRGNTATNATKQVTVESGARIDVPMFIEQDEVIIINTETGLYVERAK